MAIIGFNFTKIAAQKLSNKTGKIQVQNNIAVRDIAATKFAGDEKRQAVRVSFRYDGVYEPKIAHIQLEGDVIMLMEKSAADELIAGWKEKKAPASSLAGAMNHVLERCNIEGIMLARDMNLPSPVPLPKVNMDAGKIKNEKAAVAKKTAKK